MHFVPCAHTFTTQPLSVIVGHRLQLCKQRWKWCLIVVFSFMFVLCMLPLCWLKWGARFAFMANGYYYTFMRFVKMFWPIHFWPVRNWNDDRNNCTITRSLFCFWFFLLFICMPFCVYVLRIDIETSTSIRQTWLFGEPISDCYHFLFTDPWFCCKLRMQ